MVLAALVSAASCGPGPAPAMPPVEAGSGAKGQPTPEPPKKVSVTSARIMVDGRELMAAPAIRPGSNTLCGLGLGPLTRALQKRTSRQPLPVSVAREVPFELLCSVLRAAWSAGILRVRLETRGERALELGPPPLPPPPFGQNISLQLTVMVGDRGFFVGGAGGVMSAPDGTQPVVPCRPPLRAGRCHATGKGDRDSYQHDALARLLKRIKQTYPTERGAVVSADPAVHAGAVIRTLGVMRGEPGDAPGCKLSHGCLFDRVALDAFAGASIRANGGTFLSQVKGSTSTVPASGIRQTVGPSIINVPIPGGLHRPGTPTGATRIKLK